MRQLGRRQRRLDAVRSATRQPSGDDAVRPLPGARRVCGRRIGWERNRDGGGIAATPNRISTCGITTRARRVASGYLRGRTPVQNGPDQEGEADPTSVSYDCVEQSGQPALPRTNSTNVPVGTPVGPRGIATRSASEYAVPAMSRCTHGYSSANSLRNIAALMVPPARPPEFLISATSDLMSSL